MPIIGCPAGLGIIAAISRPSIDQFPLVLSYGNTTQTFTSMRWRGRGGSTDLIRNLTTSQALFFFVVVSQQQDPRWD